MSWSQPSAVAKAVLEADFLDTAGLEASWGFDFNAAGDAHAHASGFDTFDTHLPTSRMLTFDASDLVASKVCSDNTDDHMAAQPVPAHSSATDEFADLFTCPLGLHTSWSMCDEHCRDLPTIYATVHTLNVGHNNRDISRTQVESTGDHLWQDSKLAPPAHDYAEFLRKCTTTKQPPMASQDCAFFRLPAELRNNIYELAICSTLAIDASLDRSCAPRTKYRYDSKTGFADALEDTPEQIKWSTALLCYPLPPLLQTCQLVRKEAIYLYADILAHEPKVAQQKRTALELEASALCHQSTVQSWRKQELFTAAFKMRRECSAMDVWLKDLALLDRQCQEAIEAVMYGW